MDISNIVAREIIDSRGNPTVEVDLFLNDGSWGRASVPSGASTGSNEALELRDGDIGRFLGKGVLKAIENINERIRPEIIGMNGLNQRDIDYTMLHLDGTCNKSFLGANAILAVSIAAAKAAADHLKIPLYRYIGGANTSVLPLPMINIINGGTHSSAPIAFQEFMIRPIGAKNFREATMMGANVFHSLKRILAEDGLNTAVGDEGGFAPQLSSAEEALGYITAAIEDARYKPGKDVTIALDCAASEFYADGVYEYSKFEGKSGASIGTGEQIDYLKKLIDRFPIDSLEDPLSEEDWEGWKVLTAKIGDRCQLVGDDLFVTNLKYLHRGIREHCANAILIKPNQIGTLTETLETISLAQRGGYSCIISHRSGETEDTFISDLAVAVNAGQIKTGSMSRSERLAKYNQLLRIEEELGVNAKF